MRYPCHIRNRIEVFNIMLEKEDIKKAIEDKSVVAPFHKGEADTIYIQMSTEEWEEIWGE